MILEPVNVQVKALALMVEDGIKKGPQSEEFTSAHKTVDMHIDSFLQKLYSTENGAAKLVTPSFIKEINDQEFWSLIYFAVKEDIVRANRFNPEGQTQLSYKIASAINTLAEEHPEEKDKVIDVPLTFVDITNIIFNTEYDLVFVLAAIDYIFAALAEMEQASKAANAPEVYTPANNTNHQ